MATEHYDNVKLGGIKDTNLIGVTSNTNGASVDMRNFINKSVWIEVPVNTGAVTVTIEGSPTGAFAGEEVALQTKVYTAVTDVDVFNFIYHYPFMRVTTTSQTNATVSATITGGN